MKGVSNPCMPLRILHLTDDFSTTNTGVTSSIKQMVQWQSRHCDWVGVHSTGTVDITPPEGCELFQSRVHALTPRWRFPEGGQKVLVDLIRQHQVTHLHVHEFWRAAFVCGMLAARQVQLPTILSAHGSTAPWALRGQGIAKYLKKRIYWKLFGHFFLSPQTILHAITPLELKYMYSFFGREPQVVIPNAIDERSLPLLAEKAEIKRRFVFLGRLHPVKGVDVLVEAFIRAGLGDGWELVIAGPPEVPAYARAIEAQVLRSACAGHIRFAGPVYGQTKASLLSQAWAVVVPSKTEVIGMVNLEAACFATPTITTTHTGLTDWDQVGGILVNDDVDSVAAALRASSRWTIQERRSRGERLKAHVLQHYSLETCGQQWLDLYSAIAARTRPVSASGQHY